MLYANDDLKTSRYYYNIVRKLIVHVRACFTKGTKKEHEQAGAMGHSSHFVMQINCIFAQKCSKLDACSILINATKCPIDSKHESSILTTGLALSLVSYFRLGLGSLFWPLCGVKFGLVGHLMTFIIFISPQK